MDSREFWEESKPWVILEAFGICEGDLPENCPYSRVLGVQVSKDLRLDGGRLRLEVRYNGGHPAGNSCSALFEYVDGEWRSPYR